MSSDSIPETARGLSPCSSASPTGRPSAWACQKQNALWQSGKEPLQEAQNLGGLCQLAGSSRVRYLHSAWQAEIKQQTCETSTGFIGSFQIFGFVLAIMNAKQGQTRSLFWPGIQISRECQGLDFLKRPLHSHTATLRKS